MTLISDKLAVLLDTTTPPSADLLAELQWAWRAAFDDESEAWAAWCSGEGSYEAFAAALDREQAGASALADYQVRFAVS